MAVTAMKLKSSVESLREIVQDMLVPELKSIKISIESLHTEIKLRDEKQTQAIAHLDDKLTDSVKHLDDKLTESTRHLSENIKQLSEKLNSSIEFRERLATIEARLPRG